MDLQLLGKKIAICGATGMLGRAVAQQLSNEGARLALLGRNLEALSELATLLTHTRPDSVTVHQCDLACPQSTAAGFEAADQALQGIDVFISAAGAAQGGLFWEIDDAAWQRNLEAKLFGSIRALREVAPRMVQRKTGRIVLIVGNSAKHPEPRMLPGAAANAALLAIVRGLAEELGPHGVAINAVCPGPVRSSRWDTLMQAAATRENISVEQAEQRFLAKSALQRLATAEEIAQHVVFLASPVAAHMTGTSIIVDGGTTKTP